MPDLIDNANDTAELFLRVALANRKPEEPASLLCTFCEEQPAAILQGGARSKYCSECAAIAVAA